MTMTSEPATEPLTAAPSGSRRLLAAGADASHDRHARTFGPLPVREARAMLAQLETAGFPVWRKLAAAAEAGSRRRRGQAPILIANGSEGEPLSWKDKVLLQNAPHLVLDGMLTAARAVGARNLVLSVGSESIAAVDRAIAERPDAANIEVFEAADTFISGEASAVVNAIANDDPRPLDRTARLTDSGLRGRPTLVYNVETLAHVGLIARYGGEWFRSAGSPDEPGTRLVTVTGDVPRPGVFEVGTDASLLELLRAANVDVRTASAALIGGYHGAWVPAASFSVRVTPGELARFGAQPGAGIIHVIGAQRCGLDATAEIVEYLAGQTAQQCGPCMFGLPTLADRFAALAHGESPTENASELLRVSDLIVGRGACHHPDGTVRLIRSALDVFSADVDAHARGRCTRSPR